MAAAEKYQVDLDWANDNDQYGEMSALARGLEVLMLVEHGCGGGWPILRFTGDLEQIQALVREYTDSVGVPSDLDADDVARIIEGVEIIPLCDVCGLPETATRCVFDGICTGCDDRNYGANEEDE